MTERLGAYLRIYDRHPGVTPSGTAGGEIWRGGATDRATRAPVAEPARWLRLTEVPLENMSSEGKSPSAAADAVQPLLAWDLEQIVPGDRPAPPEAGGLVLVSMNVDPAVEDEFNDWYTTEHIPLLSQVPGMLAARRFRARSGSPRYMSLYHVTDTRIYALPEWTTANETPWMLRMRRFQKDRTYFMFPTKEEK